MAIELQRIDPWDGDTNTGLTYYGYATAGTQDTDAMWSISRKTVVNGVLKYEYPYISGLIQPNTYPAIEMNNVNYLQLSGLVWSLRSGYTYK